MGQGPGPIALLVTTTPPWELMLSQPEGRTPSLPWVHSHPRQQVGEERGQELVEGLRVRCKGV